MALPLYLAMTAAEIRENRQIPAGIAWMACHFSSYGTGLSNFPESLPPGAMLILNDRIPICGHDPDQVAAELEAGIRELGCASLLLDFQRPGEREAGEMVNTIVKGLSCPVGVSACYADAARCPVLLPPVPPDVAVEDFLRPWKDREIWLEAALDGMVITVTAEGAQAKTLLRGVPGEGERIDEQLCCHYRVKAGDGAVFTLRRTEEDLRRLLKKAEKLGVSRAVGLYQELAHLRINE